MGQNICHSCCNQAEENSEGNLANSLGKSRNPQQFNNKPPECPLTIDHTIEKDGKPIKDTTFESHLNVSIDSSGNKNPNSLTTSKFITIKSERNKTNNSSLVSPFRESEYKNKPSDKNLLFNNYNSNPFTSSVNEKIEKIKLNYYTNLIIKMFRNLKNKKQKSHENIAEIEIIESSEKYKQYKTFFEKTVDINLFPEKEHQYIGSLFNNKKDGFGQEIFPNESSKYLGTFLNGNRTNICNFSCTKMDLDFTYQGYVEGYFADNSAFT